MKFILAALAATVSLSCLAPVEADAKSRNTRKSYVEHREYRGVYDRPHSVQNNGLCQRDTGVPTSQLSFRNKCETEEYWNRVFSGGRRR